MSSLFIPLDVEYASDDEFIEAGPMAELLYIRALCFAKRKTTDGYITRGQLSVFTANIPAAKKHAAKLVEVGLWETTSDGWFIPAYLKRNPSKSDIEVQTTMSREAGERGNHERWHVGPDGKPSPKCRLCRADRIANPIGGAIGCPTGGTNRGRSPETETETETETESVPETESISPTAAASPPSSESTEAAAAAIDLLIEHDIATGRARQPTGWRHSMPAKYRTEHGPALTAHLENHPDATPADLARHVLGLSELDLHRLTERSA